MTCLVGKHFIDSSSIFFHYYRYAPGQVKVKRLCDAFIAVRYFNMEHQRPHLGTFVANPTTLDGQHDQQSSAAAAAAAAAEELEI
jgi:hypothetical protein